MTSQNALANAKLLFKALAAREANLGEPIPNIRITDVAVQIGLKGDEFDSALDYAADQGWFEDAEVADSASWISLTPAGVAAAKWKSCRADQNKSATLPARQRSALRRTCCISGLVRCIQAWCSSCADAMAKVRDPSSIAPDLSDAKILE
jgi:hypothetical protein